MNIHLNCYTFMNVIIQQFSERSTTLIPDQSKLFKILKKKFSAVMKRLRGCEYSPYYYFVQVWTMMTPN